nr:integrase, catalytic region, zinc finger, CCHC-type, peptidase aspartic, catalytic [Tanacetum cinerariifolium]
MTQSFGKFLFQAYGVISILEVSHWIWSTVLSSHELCARITTPRSHAASLDTMHTNIVGNAQTIYNESLNSAYLPNEDFSQAGTSSLNHSKRTQQNPHPRPAPGDETAFSVAAHVNNVNSTSSTTGDSSRVGIPASNPRKRTHQNALARSVQSEECPSKRVLHSTPRVENRRVTIVTCGSREGCSSDQTGGSELGSELTSLAGSELTFLAGSELQGKENRVNILKSIDEGPFRMGKIKDTLTEGNEGALHLGPEQPRVYSDLTSEDKDRFVTAVKLNSGLRDSNYDQLYAYLKQHENLTNTLSLLTQSYKTYLPQTNNQLRTSSNPRNQATIQDGKVVVQNVQGQHNRGHVNNARGQVQLVMGELRTELEKMLLMQAQENGVTLDEEQLLFIAGGQDNAVDEDVDEQPIQDLALNVDNMFHADDRDAFDSDIDEAHTAQTLFMANLSSAYPVYDETGPSYDSGVLSEVHDHDHYQDVVCEHHDVHEIHDDVQPNYVVDSHTDYMSDNNMIPYDQYNKVVDKSLTAELVTYNEEVELYKRRARIELTEREQKIDKQLRIVITDRNIKEEILKKELHSVKMQLASTINHNKSMVEEVTFLKKDFKQKENKYLEEFLDMKALKERVEDKLFKQDESLQTVHMLCKPKHYYDEQKKAAIGYKSPLCLTSTKQALTTEIKEMKAIFDELEAEVDQNVVNRKYSVTPKVLAPGMYAIDVEPIPPRLRNNREVHLDYLKHLKESVATLREIVKKAKVVQIVLWYLDSGCSKHMTGDRSRLRNFVKKFTRTVRFDNDHFGAIMGYGDYVISDNVISRVYYVEGLGHNLFSVGQLYDSDLEVAFRKHSCYVQDSDGVELIKGSRGSNLYTISVEDMMKSSLIFLLSKASKTKSWSCHRRLNHLNFGTINDLTRKDLIRGLPRLKFEKDHLYSA